MKRLFAEKTQTATHFAQRNVLYLDSTKYFFSVLSFSFFIFSFSSRPCILYLSLLVAVSTSELPISNYKTSTFKYQMCRWIVIGTVYTYIASIIISMEAKRKLR